MIILYRFVSEKHDGGSIGGVPLGDITKDAFAALPIHLQRSVQRCGYYEEVKPEPVIPIRKFKKAAAETAVVEDGDE